LSRARAPPSPALAQIPKESCGHLYCSAPSPDTRELRALRLYEERGGEILRTGPHTYEVPSCTGAGSYAVDYKAESCDCPDARRHPDLNCKHVLAVAVKRAKRRGNSARLLARIEERYRNDPMDTNERLELLEVIVCLRRKLGL
jgi:hypothetical protein